MRTCSARLRSATTRAAKAATRVAAVPRTSHAAAPAEGSQTLRRLIFLRHAESDQTSGVRDHDRPISNVGKQQAAQVAQLLKDKGWMPDLVLASNSKRTKQTLDEMAEVMDELADVDAHFYGSLYTVAALDGQTGEHIAECMLEVCDDVRNRVVMCVGHNKGWEEAASQFAGQAVKLKTASAALMQCYAPTWREVLKAEGVTWQLVDVVVPAV